MNVALDRHSLHGPKRSNRRLYNAAQNARGNRSAPAQQTQPDVIEASLHVFQRDGSTLEMICCCALNTCSISIGHVNVSEGCVRFSPACDSPWPCFLCIGTTFKFVIHSFETMQVER
jgi:hypothetical protein